MNKSLQEQLTHLLIKETHRRLFEEGIPRIKKCLAELSEEDIWYRPNKNSNSVGNLVLHLCGNVRQWIGNGLGKLPNIRERASEFEEKGPLPTEHLLLRLEEMEQTIRPILKQLSTEDLIRTGPVQIYEETGVAILIHVVEHFSYHVGQITYFTKARKDMDIGYYADDDL